MTTLRVYLDAPPDTGRDADWVLFDAQNRGMRAGRGPRADWPTAEVLEAVIGAGHGRLVTLTLPPLPAARASAAARYALEDQLAGAPADSHIALGAQGASGALSVAIVADAWMRALVTASARNGIRWHRVILESDLAQPPAGGWCWCAAALDRAGFVRTAEGATIAVGPARADAPPDELVLALAASRATRPRTVRVDIAGVTPALMARARALTGVEFIQGSAWRWFAVPPPAFAMAIDLQTGAYNAAPATPRPDLVRMLRPALWIAACALGIHVLGSVGQWAWLHWQATRIERDLIALAQGTAPEESANAAPAAAIARRDAELRHRAGLSASDDALPLLARAAPALSALPAGSIRSLRYADGHVVFELQKLDANQPARLQRDLQQAGVVAIAAPTAAGSRLRIGLD
jgi:general secretion pathway protein L